MLNVLDCEVPFILLYHEQYERGMVLATLNWKAAAPCAQIFRSEKDQGWPMLAFHGQLTSSLDVSHYSCQASYLEATFLWNNRNS